MVVLEKLKEDCQIVLMEKGSKSSVSVTDFIPIARELGDR